MKNHVVNLCLTSKISPQTPGLKPIGDGLQPGDIVLHRSGAVVQVAEVGDEFTQGIIYSGVQGTYAYWFLPEEFVCVLGQHDVEIHWSEFASDAQVNRIFENLL